MADMKDDGGPAFPHYREVYSHHDDAGKEVRIPVVHPGMSLRQWYAGLAMQGLLANGQPCFVEKDAITRADALIAQLKKE